jgi:hypothetical protein
MWFNPAAITKPETPPPANLRIADTETAHKHVEIRKLAKFAAPRDSKTNVSSGWWQLHFVDDDPREIWTDPAARYAEIMERHPDAIAAEPINQCPAKLANLRISGAAPATSCSTCEHLTGHGACGEPGAAGLSALPGVIRYSPDQGATCPDWLATISGDLEARILAMAERWDYSGDDLALVLAGARSDPDGWRRVAEADEQIGGGIYGG